MFELFRSKRSPVRVRVERVSGVRRTWIEWELENGMRTPTLVVEYEYDLDPASADFDADVFGQIMAAANAVERGETAPPRLRVIPWTPAGG